MKEMNQTAPTQELMAVIRALPSFQSMHIENQGTPTQDGADLGKIAGSGIEGLSKLAENRLDQEVENLKADAAGGAGAIAGLLAASEYGARQTANKSKDSIHLLGLPEELQPVAAKAAKRQHLKYLHGSPGRMLWEGVSRPAGALGILGGSALGGLAYAATRDNAFALDKEAAFEPEGLMKFAHAGRRT